MKLVGYIGTAVSLLLALALQQFSADEFTRLLTWAVPSAVSLVSWALTIVFHAKKLRDLIKADIGSTIEKLLQARMKDFERDIEKKLSGIQSGVVDEVWNRLDTIMNLKRIGAALAKEDDKTEPQS